MTRVLGDRTRLRYFSYIKSPRNGAVAIFNGGAGALRALDAARSDLAFVSRRSRNEFFLPATRAHFALAPALPIEWAEPFEAQDKQAPPLQVKAHGFDTAVHEVPPFVVL